jgi:hypothetical protein
MVRRGASLDADQAWRQLLEECQHVAPLQLVADDHLATRIDAVVLKDRLSIADIQREISHAVCTALSLS